MAIFKAALARKSEEGSSLLEITVALGLLAFLSMAVAQVSNNSMLSQKTSNGVGTFDDIVNAAGILLLRDSTCTTTLAGQSFDPTSTTGSAVVLTLPNGNPLLPAGNVSADGAIQFDSVNLVATSTLPQENLVIGAALTTVNVNFASLTITGERLGKYLGGKYLTQTVINIPIATTPDNIIRYCAGITTSGQYDLCNSHTSPPNTPAVCPSGTPSVLTMMCISGTVCP